MIHDFRTSEVLVPMVLVYLYLDPIYVNVNPITFCLSDLDLVIRKFHPHKCNTRHCLLQLLYIMARALWEPFALQYEQHSLENTHNCHPLFFTNLVPPPINEGVGAWR